MTRKTEIFEKMPVGKAVAVLAIPTILSQLVTMIYNLADTYFIGLTANPQMVAAASLAFPAFLLLTALSNLFGIGGGSLISRLLGAKSFDDTKKASAFSFYGCLVVTAVYSALIFTFMTPLLNLLGASKDTFEYAKQYLFWTTVVGGIPTTISVLIGNLLRSEGRVAFASIGMAMGGIINIILDPIFIFGFDKGIEGAAIATMIANVCSMVYFFIVYAIIRKKSVISLNPRNFTPKKSISGSIVSVGIPSFVSLMLVCVSNAFMLNLASQYCTDSVSAPVGFSDGEGDVEDIVNRGFLLNWIASNCSLCETTGGKCGFDYKSYHFKCFCPDMPHAARCHSGMFYYGPAIDR